MGSCSLSLDYYQLVWTKSAGSVDCTLGEPHISPDPSASVDCAGARLHKPCHKWQSGEMSNGPAQQQLLQWFDAHEKTRNLGQILVNETGVA